MFVDVAVDFSDRDRLRTYTYAVPAGFPSSQAIWCGFPSATGPSKG